MYPTSTVAQFTVPYRIPGTILLIPPYNCIPVPVPVPGTVPVPLRYQVRYRYRTGTGSHVSIPAWYILVVGLYQATARNEPALGRRACLTSPLAGAFVFALDDRNSRHQAVLSCMGA